MMVFPWFIFSTLGSVPELNLLGKPTPAQYLMSQKSFDSLSGPSTKMAEIVTMEDSQCVFQLRKVLQFSQ